MRRPPPLARALDRVLFQAALRRVLAWLPCALAILALGTAMGALAGVQRLMQLGSLMLVLSALPAFILWPTDSSLLWSRLRWLDEESVFEAYLEAPPGPSRLLLAQLARSKASALPFRSPARGRPFRGLGPLFLGAALAIALVETGSLVIRGRGISLLPTSATPPGTATRTEDSDFSDYATEDPAVRRERRELSLESAQSAAQNRLGAPSSAPGGEGAVPASRRARTGPQGELDFPGSPQGGSPETGASAEAPGSSGAAGSSPQPAAGGPGQQGQASSTGPRGAAAAVPGTNPAAGSGDEAGPGASRGRSLPKSRPAGAGVPGQGYDKTGNTGVPSPLLDYRSRFASVFADRTGTQISAGDRLELGELRDFQRRLFGSFRLATDLGVAEDPYTALLKRRWAELRGGAP